MVHVDLETLGGRWVEDHQVDSSGKRLINYHAGQTPDAGVTITDPLFDDGNDPLQQLASEPWFGSSLDELWAESRLAARKVMDREPW